MIALLDYGSGNLRSAERALSSTGHEVVITSDFDLSLNANGLVVPGVGAFGTCMLGLRRVQGEELIRKRFELDRPTLGICVGMQVLFDQSSESPEVDGVGIFTSRIERLSAPITPHMGWNRVSAPPDSQLFHGLNDEQFYFVHSYALKESPRITGGNEDVKVSTATYGEKFIAGIEYRSLSATQFHPEKSGDAGLQLLDNWVRSLD